MNFGKTRSAEYIGNKTLYPPEDDSQGWSISENQQWLPGSYESREAALLAFKWNGTILQDLQDSVNPGGIITLDMLKEVEEAYKELTQ